MHLYGYTTHTVESGRHTFNWRGGEYVQISNSDPLRDDTEPFDVINVWDYETGLPLIPFTLDALLDRVGQWYKDQAEVEADA